MKGIAHVNRGRALTDHSTGGSPASGAWPDAVNALNQMRRVTLPPFFGLALLIALPMIANGGPIRAYPQTDSPSTLALVGLYTLLLSFAESVLLTPLAIAVHRFILRGERTERYRLDLSNPRTKRFIAYGFLLDLIWLVPQEWVSLAGYSTPTRLVAWLILGVGAGLVVTRLILLFPAIAIDAPQAALRDARALARGSTWTILWAILATALLGCFFSLAALPLLIFAGYSLTHFGIVPGALMLGIAMAAFILVPTTALVAVASRLYRTLNTSAEPIAETA